MLSCVQVASQQDGIPDTFRLEMMMQLQLLLIVCLEMVGLSEDDDTEDSATLEEGLVQSIQDH